MQLDAQVLIDNFVPKRFKHHLPPFVVTHVSEVGWSRLEDGELLTFADEAFDVVITVDQHIPEQQNLSRYNLALIILFVPTNRLPDLLPVADQTIEALRVIKPGQLKRIVSPFYRKRRK